MNTPLDILKKYWGYSSFRGKQEEIILSAITNDATVALLPTGGGKSICFQIPALIKKGVCIVISPLISLMEDQVSNLKKRGIKATTIPSGYSQDDIVILFDNIKYGNIKFLYLSPERIQSKFIQEKISHLNISLIAIDEAHCISQWGHDFRPSFKNIKILKEIHPKAKIIALTATATKKVLKDIIINLNLNLPKIYKTTFTRKNLAYQIYYIEDKLYRLVQIFKKIKDAGIIYVNTRSRTKQINYYLNSKGFKATFYHAGLSVLEKNIAFKEWISEKKQIMVATNAFGMGIDKSNVRVVVHYDLPNSIENYVQEAGRAGRDNKKAFSVVLTNQSDIFIKKELTKKTLPSINDISEVLEKLYQNFYISIGEKKNDILNFDFLSFCNKYNFSTNKTNNIIQILQNNEIIQLNKNKQKKSTLKFLISGKHLIQYSNSSIKTKKIIQFLLRIYSGLFENDVLIDEFYIANKINIRSVDIIYFLKKLHDQGIAKYNKGNTNYNLFFLKPREYNITINKVSKNIKIYLKQKEKKVNQLIQFISNKNICRNIQLLEYFEEKRISNCGICDICISKKISVKNISKKIVYILKNKSMDSREICLEIEENENDVLINLKKLLSEEKIYLHPNNKYYLKK